MFCKKCGQEINEGSKFCKKCGNPIGSLNKETTVKQQTINKDHWTIFKKKSFLWSLNAIVVFLFFGNFHIITGGKVGFDIVSRDSFGFSEIFINVDEITNTPWIAAKIKYPIGCRVLEREGLIESDEDFKNRIKQNFDKTLDINSFQILSHEVQMVDYHFVLKIKIQNVGVDPAGVELQCEIKDEDGNIVKIDEWWPASTSNIPQGATFEGDHNIYGLPENKKLQYTVSVKKVRTW